MAWLETLHWLSVTLPLVAVLAALLTLRHPT